MVGYTYIILPQESDPNLLGPLTPYVTHISMVLNSSTCAANTPAWNITLGRILMKDSTIKTGKS